MQIEDFKEMLDAMNQEEIESLVDNINQFNYKINLRSSQCMKRTGFICLLITCANVLLNFLLGNFNIVSIISICICLFVTIFDFYQSFKYKKQASICEKQQIKQCEEQDDSITFKCDECGCEFTKALKETKTIISTPKVIHHCACPKCYKEVFKEELLKRYKDNYYE